MDHFIWKPQFNIGITKIDHQHKLLLNHLNNCLTSLTNIDVIFIELKKYSSNHFCEEEFLMRKVNYPEFVMHKKEHQFYEDRIQSLEDSVLKSESKSIEKMVLFLRDWFLDHILKQDRHFADYLRSKMNYSEIVDLLTDAT